MYIVGSSRGTELQESASQTSYNSTFPSQSACLNMEPYEYSFFQYFDLKSEGILDHGNRAGVLGLEPVHRKRSRFRDLSGVSVLTQKLFHGNCATGNHGFLGFADPDARVVEFLVGLISTSGVSNLSLQIIVLVLFKFTQTIPVGPLSISINVHLADTVLNSGLDFSISGTRSSVHDQEDGLIVVASQLFLGVGLVPSKTLGLKGDVSWLVDAVDVSKSSGDGEHVSNFGETFVNSKDLLRAGVKLFGVDCNNNKMKEVLKSE